MDKNGQQGASADSNINDIYISCGSQCNPGQTISPCGESTCKQCAEGAVNAYRTSITRRYQMDTNDGEFYFKYETFSIEYRMLIFNGETQIYDSECLTKSSSGETIRKISLNGQSQEFRVDIGPECRCVDSKRAAHSTSKFHTLFGAQQ